MSLRLTDDAQLELRRLLYQVAETVSEARRANNLTQSDMANYLGTSLSTYRKIETADGTVAAEVLLATLIRFDKRHCFQDFLKRL